MQKTIIDFIKYEEKENNEIKINEYKKFEIKN